LFELREHFSFTGNHKDLLGNPLGYTRTTTRQKWNPKYRDYQEYKNWVVQQYWLQHGRSSVEKPFKDKLRGLVIIDIEFASERHADPDNVGKAILDALFEQDKEIDLHVNHTCQNPESRTQVLIYILNKE